MSASASYRLMTGRMNTFESTGMRIVPPYTMSSPTWYILDSPVTFPAC